MGQGIFITIEGVDGAGKSSQIEGLRLFLASAGYSVVCTEEPGGTEIGGQIRAILLNRRNAALGEITEVFLYAAARAQHVREIISPALAAGHAVICSRFTDSTVAYQGYGGGVDRNLIDMVNAAATGGVVPDLTLLFDLPPEEGLERVRRRTGADGTGDRIESRQVAFHTRVREGFLQLAAAEPARIKIIPAGQPPADVQRAVREAVAAYLRLKGKTV